MNPHYWQIFESEYPDLHTPIAPRYAMASGWWEVNEDQKQPPMNLYEYWRFEMCKAWQHAAVAYEIMMWHETAHPKN